MSEILRLCEICRIFAPQKVYLENNPLINQSMPKSISLKKLIKYLLPVGIIATLLASVTTVPVSAEGYLPVLEDGREWVYGDSLRSSRPGPAIDEWHHEMIAGDTVIDNFLWKKLTGYTYLKYPDITLENPFCGYYYENDGILYYSFDNSGNACYNPDNKHLDMNLKVGDEFGLGVVIKVDSIKVRGVVRKRISLNDCKPIEDEVFFVEGIGASSDAYVDYTGGYEWGQARYLLYVKDKNGNVIFTQADFRAPSYTSSGIEAIESDAVEDHRIFDLYGRPVSHPIPGTIYIRNGRKFVQPRE